MTVDLNAELNILYKHLSIQEIRKMLNSHHIDLDFYRSKNPLSFGDTARKRVFLEEMELLQKTIEFLEGLLKEKEGL